jgi:hypothetical protein
MPKNSDRALHISVLSVATVAVVALAVAVVALVRTFGSSTTTASAAPSSVITTSPPPADTTTPPAPSTTGRLTGVRDGSKVAFHQPVNGVVTGLPPGTDVWIVVEPISAPAFWPQLGPLALLPTGAFRASVYFGASATQNVGEQFITLLVVAPPAASSRFQAFAASNPSQGLTRLPPGLLILARVAVTRRLG